MSIGRPRGGKNRCHSKDFKMQIVERCLSGEGTEVLAKEFELSGSMIRKWVRMFNQKGASALENRKKPGNPLGGIYRKKNLSEVDRLRFELAQAEVQLAKLKKAYEVERSVAQRKR